MYLQHFGFAEPPFSIAPDPRYLYMSEKHREGLAHLLFGLQSDCGFVLLTGEVGTGKTTICRCLLDQIPPETDLAFVLNPKVTVEELLATICEEFGLGVQSGGTGRKIMIDRLNRYLLDNHAQGRRAVLIIDEAQNLGADLLEQLRLLTNLETNQRKLLQILLLGQPELRDKLASPDLRQLSQRISARYHLEPLNREEVGRYVAHRLAMAGGRANLRLFPPAVLKLLYRLSGGVPRVINIICDRSLLGAYAEDRDKIDCRIMRTAAREVAGIEPRRSGAGPKAGRWRLGMSLALVPLALGVVWIQSSSFSPPFPVPAAEVASQAGEPGEPEGTETLPPMEIPTESLEPQAAGLLVQNQESAFESLLAQWGVHYDPAAHGEGCRYAAGLGLQCLERQDGWEVLLRFNLPAILKLAEAEESFFTTLTGVAGGRAVLGAGPQAREVSIDQLAGKWQGGYILLWQPPPAYRAPLQVGAREPLVAWISERLARIDGRDPAAVGQTYDQEMARRVKAFQFSAGLVPDGIVGPQTLIRLGSASGERAPKLRPAEEGG